MIQRSLLAAGSLLVAALGPGALRAADPSAASVAGHSAERIAVVVLQNGSTLAGHVEETADRLIVSNGPASVVRVPVADVDFVAPDWAAAYHTQRARIERTDLRRHLRLAQWCLRHDLEPFAADQLLHLMRLAPHDPSVKALEYELRRRAGSADEPASVASTTASPAATETNSGPVKASELQDDLPPVSAGALAEFTRAIQPLLLNRCGQTTCHGRAGESRFHLQRLTASGSERRTLTLRNLRAAIAQLDATGSPASPLLEYAVRAHGRSQLAPLGPHDSRQFDRLCEWVNWVVAGERVDEVPPEESLPGGPDMAVDILARPQRMPPTAALPLTKSPPARPSAPGTTDEVDSANSTPPTEPVNQEPVDPYDPAAFNARFSSDPPADTADR